MSKRTSVLVLCILCVSVVAGAETLDEVLAKNYEARGGLEALQAVGSVKITGTMSMGGGIQAPFTFYWQRPDKMRSEFTLQGITGVQAYDGETGWMLMPFMGKTEPEKIPEELVEAMEDEADFEGPLVNWREKGHQVELVGKDEVEGTEVYTIRLTRSNGNVSTIYLDAEYFLEIKSKGSREINGQEIEFEASTGDYKEVGGLMLPHSVISEAPGIPGGGQTMTIETIELDPELDPSIFSMPEVEAPTTEDDAAG